MVRNYPYIKNEELRDLIKRFCFANSIKIKHVYRMNKTQLYDIIEKYEIMEWILKKQKKMNTILIIAFIIIILGSFFIEKILA